MLSASCHDMILRKSGPTCCFEIHLTKAVGTVGIGSSNEAKGLQEGPPLFQPEQPSVAAAKQFAKQLVEFGCDSRNSFCWQVAEYFAKSTLQGLLYVSASRVAQRQSRIMCGCG